MADRNSGSLAWASLVALAWLNGCATEVQESLGRRAGLSNDGGAAGEVSANGGASSGSAGVASSGAGSSGSTPNAGSSGSGGHSGAGALGGSSSLGGAVSGGQAGSAEGGAGGNVAGPKPCGKTRLAVKGATASSIEDNTHAAAQAADGDAGTRWASLPSDPQWIYFDLGQVAHVSRVLISWEVAYARDYRLEIAQAAAGPWQAIFREPASDGGMDDITSLTPSNGRYVRMYGNQRGTEHGYSIWEFEIDGDLDVACK
jgi:F5/8 type C domain